MVVDMGNVGWIMKQLWRVRSGRPHKICNKNIEYARAMARRLRAEGVEGITLTHFADEASFHAMRLPEEGDDFEYRQLVNTETAKIMIAHGLQLEVQVLYGLRL